MKSLALSLILVALVVLLVLVPMVTAPKKIPTCSGVVPPDRGEVRNGECVFIRGGATFAP